LCFVVVDDLLGSVIAGAERRKEREIEFKEIRPVCLFINTLVNFIFFF